MILDNDIETFRVKLRIKVLTDVGTVTRGFFRFQKNSFAIA